MMKRFSIPLSFLTIIITALIIAGCGTNYDKVTDANLNKFSQDGSVDKLTGFINYASAKEDILSSKEALVRQAINLLATKNAEKGLPELSKYLTNTVKEKKNTSLSKLILSELNKANAKVSPISMVIDLAIANKDDQNLTQEISTLLPRYPNDEVVATIKQALIALHKEGDTSKYQVLLPLLERSGIQYPPTLKRMFELHKSSVENGKKLKETKALYTKIEENIKKLQAEGFPSGPILELTAFMVQQYNDNTYEIAFLTHDSLLGTIPSDKRAILETVKTKFTSRGQFSMLVIKTGKREVTLTQEAGGFKQVWDVYKEIPPEQRQKAQALASLWQDKNKYNISGQKYLKWSSEANQDFDKLAK